MQYPWDGWIFRWLPTIAYLIAEPNMRAIIQNLVATALWQLGRMAVGFWKTRDRNAPLVTRSDQSLLPVFLTALQTTFAKGLTELTLKTQTSKYKKCELIIKMKKLDARRSSCTVSASHGLTIRAPPQSHGDTLSRCNVRPWRGYGVPLWLPGSHRTCPVSHPRFQ